MTALEAARLGDEIGHSSALGGLLTGIVVGIALAVAVVAIVGTGGVAAVAIGAGIAAAGAGGGLAGMHIGELIPGKTCSGIKEGSPDTDIEGKPAARAGLDESGHNSKLVAQGSSTVFVNQHMLARKTDKIECGGKVKTFAKTVLVGGEVATASGMHIDDEVPGWLVTTLKVVAIAGTVVATGGVAAVAGWGVALGGLGGGILGGAGLGWVGGKVGGWIGGELGARIGEAVGGFAGGMLGGMAGARLGGWLRPPPTRPTLTETPPEPAPIAPTEPRTGPYVKMEDGYYRDRLFMDHPAHDRIPAEGWKLHVSADDSNAHQVADRVLPMLREMKVNHKVMADPEAYSKMTGTQAGKFITIYPDNPEQAVAITQAVDGATKGLSGPVIAGERPVGDGGLVYTRYGGFTKSTVTDPATGLEVPDVRGQTSPPWVEDPFK